MPKGFSKNRIGRDVEYILDDNPRVTILRECRCGYNCSSTWAVRVDNEIMDSGYHSRFRLAVSDAIQTGKELTP
jgi:hypothetical protein